MLDGFFHIRAPEESLKQQKFHFHLTEKYQEETGGQILFPTAKQEL